MRSRHCAQDSAEIFGRSCMMLWTDIRMITLDLEYEYSSWWKCRRWLVWEGLWMGWRLGKGRAIFLKGSPGQEELLVGEDGQLCRRGSSSCGKSSGSTTLLWLSSPSSIQKCFMVNASFSPRFSTCPGNVCSLNSQIHFAGNFTHRRWVLSAFSYHVCNGPARYWKQGQLSLPEQTTFLGLWN